MKGEVSELPREPAAVRASERSGPWPRYLDMPALVEQVMQEQRDQGSSWVVRSSGVVAGDWQAKSRQT